MSDGEALRGQVRWARELAAALSATPDGLVARLGRGVVEDPHPGVRRRFLEVLRDRHPASGRTVAEAALEGPDLAVRLIAAQLQGRSDLLLDIIVDPSETEGCRPTAMACSTPTKS